MAGDGEIRALTRAPRRGLQAPADPRRSSPARSVARFATLLLLLAAALVLVRVYRFGQERFFTIDEYQFGHATWLVAEGYRPYADFCEHHFPLSYVLHAALLPDHGSFADRALTLRKIAFGYLFFLCLVLGLTGQVATGNRYGALLSSFLPLAFGFSLMSAIDYRADNFAAVLLMACLGLLEANRGGGRRSAAAAGGVLAALSVLMTQKMLFVAGGSFALIWGVDRLRSRRSPEPPGEPLLRRPGTFAASAAAVLAIGLGVGGWLGLLSPGFEATILHALEHEALHPEEVSSFAEFAEPFFAYTWTTTVPILLLALVHLASRRGRFWLIPVCVATLTGALQKAQYPYDYVLPCFAVVLCAIRGFAQLLEPVGTRDSLSRRVRPAFYLLPLLVLPNQLGFLSHTSSNQHQLRILNEIEAFSGEDDVVIDGAGGALFRDHASYYWQHGEAHRRIFADDFARDLLEDYRRSRALFWIDDFRQRKLPFPIREFFRRHYIEADGSLYALGFQTPPTEEDRRELEIDVIRAGSYFVIAILPPAERSGREGGPLLEGRLWIDSEPVRETRLHLEEGPHRVTVAPHSPPYVISPLPPAVFEHRVGRKLPHAPLFEYEWREDENP